MEGLRLKSTLGVFIFLILLICFSLSCRGDCHLIPLIPNGTWEMEGSVLESILTPESSGHKCFSNYTFEVIGPCNLSLKWAIQAGSNYLELFYDGNRTPYAFYKRNEKLPWHPADTQIINYTVDKIGPHELKICHGNSWGTGIAEIHYISKEDLRPKLLHPSYLPSSGVAIDESCDAGCILNVFNYTLQIDELIPQEVELLIRSPGSNYSISQGKGICIDHGIFNWPNIKIISNQTGQSYYWFKETFSGESKPINSSEYLGPKIINLVLKAYLEQSMLNSSYYEDRYYIRIYGDQPRSIKLYMYKDGIAHLFQSFPYEPDEDQDHLIVINSTVRIGDVIPESWAFDII